MFNPQARWDRKLPQQDNQYELIDEPVSVACFFSGGKPEPRYFIWNNKLFKVKTINFLWQGRQGGETISYFSLTTNFGIYQLSFSNVTFSWKIDRVIST